MAIVAGIRFKDAGKVYYFDPGELTLTKGDYAIVETARGMECGFVSMGNRDVPDSEIVPPLKQIIRKATEADLRHVKENERRQQEAFAICEQKILDHGLDMKLVDVEYTFDNNKILFYFTSDGRVDFRNLVKDLASVFRTRIELRQIGVRDEAKMLGGLGICGRPFCCSQFLGDFQPVSIKMAKEQGLSLNPVKISGTCGRLMCCLKYEQNVYEELIRITPRTGSVVTTPEGRGVVVDQNLIAGTVSVRPERDPDAAPKTWKVSELIDHKHDRSGKCEKCEHADSEAESDVPEKKPERTEKKAPQTERRSDRLDRKADRSEKPEKAEHTVKPEKTETNEAPEVPERPAVPEIMDAPAAHLSNPEVIPALPDDNADTEPRTERKNDRNNRPRNDRHKGDRNRFNRNDKPAKPDRTEKTETADKPETAEAAPGPERTEKADRPRNDRNRNNNYRGRNNRRPDRPARPRENKENIGE